jgi:hypothetical protein
MPIGTLMAARDGVVRSGHSVSGSRLEQCDEE